MKSMSISRFNEILLLFILVVVILYFGKTFLVPLCFSILLGTLLLPVCDWLEKKGFSRVWSTLTGIFIILSMIAGVAAILVGQGSALADDLPQMQARAQQLLTDTQQWVEQQYNIAPEEQMAYVSKGIDKLSESGGSFFSNMLSGLMGLLTGLVLVLLYFFFIMWKREKYKEFILKLVNDQNRSRVSRELEEISKVSSQYLMGRLISMGFLAIVYMIGFSIVGLPNALLMALIAVLPTIVPYVGAFVGGFFPVIMALAGDESGVFLPVVGILIIAQVIDNNIIEPLVEGESLDLSPIFTIIALVIGELLWGVAGMILFMPLFAIIRIICSRIPELHPYSFLLENDMHEPKWVQAMKKWFGKKK